MRTEEEIRQRAMAILLRKMRQRTQAWARQFLSPLVSRRMAGHATDLVKELAACPGIPVEFSGLRKRTGRLANQKVSDRLGHFRSLLFRLARQQVRHGDVGLRLGGIGDEAAQVMRGDPPPYLRQVGATLRRQASVAIAMVAGHAVQFA